ncbi:sugar-binding transcriptional regulator [Brevibacillus daliensis]|uniref:sugar-binding transcriptional regulator n=1 Tax=Brevibacillus daliensis TaxID=2892995 RepID=UPI001E2E1042|nr:sugar-binding transcriptional regulator [Brevibacillus daliensis]
MSSKNSLLIRVAELYYQHKMNQSEIAKIIGTSRPSVSRLLDEAREQGIVTITINTPIKKNPSLSEAIRTKYHLRDVIVISGSEDYDTSMLNVGHAVAEYLLGFLDDNMSIGISWGRALKAVVSSLPQTNLNNILAVQLIGSLGVQDNSLEGTELIYLLAKQLNGKYCILNSPAYVSSKMLQQEMLEEPQIKEVIELGRKVDITINGIGTFDIHHNTLRKAGILNNHDITILKEKGTVGHIMGRMYNINGDEIKLDNHFPITGELDILRNAPMSIGCVVSAERAEATIGALNGKLINVLICDETVALKILE